MTRYSHLSIAIPVLAEYDNLPSLFESLKRQTFSDFDVYVCVNNPNTWSESEDERERSMYLDNQASLGWLSQQQRQSENIHVLDFSSSLKGWIGKKRGVGWARKSLFDAIITEHGDNELVVSLDADTGFGDKYFETLLEVFNDSPDSSCLAVPYYHPLSGDEMNDRAMLRYEIYMRHYLISMLDVANSLKAEGQHFPYAFTALGSAMVFPAWAYRRVGGITPLQGGEDFYLMQKFAKTGKVLLSCSDVVRPQGRPSLRVPFGTGPAIAKGVDSMDNSYPLYPHEAFDAVSNTFCMFPMLYDVETETPMTQFLRDQLKRDDIWQPLRKNFKTRELFVHACQERVDGLRILQFLKFYREQMAALRGTVLSSEEELRHCCKSHGISMPDDFSFVSSSLAVISNLRDKLFEEELSLRRHH